MSGYGTYAVAALVVVAVLSVGVHEAVARTGPADLANCGSAEIAVRQFEPRDEQFEELPETAYSSLSSASRAAFDRARAADGPVSVDTGLVTNSSLAVMVRGPGGRVPVATVVREGGESYHVNPRVSDCALVAGVPWQANPVIRVFDGIYRVFSPLYLPVAGIAAVVAAYRRVDDWLRFG